MKSRFAFALAVVGLIHSGIFAQTFIPTSGNQFWNVNSNWSTDPAPFPNGSGVPTILPVPTGDLSIDLGVPITVGSVTVNKSTTSNFNTTIGVGATNTLTFDGGTSTLSNGFSSTFTTGQTTVAAPIVFGAAMPSSTFTASQGGASTLALTGVISGTGTLKVTRDTNGTGAVVLGAANTYNGGTSFTNGQTNQNYLLVRLDDANSIPGGIGDTGGTSNIAATGSVIIGLGASDFTRGLGTGPDKIQFLTQGNSGWAAFGQDRVVKVCCNIIGTPPERLIWGSSGANFGTLILGHNLADKTIDLQNRLDLQTSTGSVTRTIRIANGTAAVDAKISAPIVTGGVGPGNLILTGSSLGDGTVSLTAVNTYNGTTTISSGATVRLEIASALPSGNLIFATNGVLGLGIGNDTFTRALGASSNQVTFSSGGGFAAFGGNKTVNLGGAGGTLTWGGANFIPTANSLTLSDIYSNATLDFQNGIDLGVAGDRTVLTYDGSAVVDAKLSGVITGTGNLRKNTPGTLEVSNANTYTGTTVINAGTLLLTNATSIPGGIGGGNTNGISFTGTAENPVPTLGLGQGDLTSELNAAPGAGQIGVISPGTNAGFAAYGANRVVNFKLASVTQQAIWATGGFVTGVLGLSASGADATVDLQNPIDLNSGARRVKVANGLASIDGMLSGVISGAGSSLEKDGSGTLKVTAANTYDGGTTLTQGRLLVSNSTGSGTGSGPVAVNAGTLGGTGSISGTVTVASGAHVAPGESVESLAMGSLILNTGSILDFELGAPGSPGVTSDLINVLDSSGLTLNGGSVALTDAGGLAAGIYTLIDYAGTLGGSVANLGTPTGPAGFTFALSNNTSNTSIDLQVTAAGLPGDFNSDGKVDAGDYVTWRKNNGTSNALANDNGLGTPVGPAHYNLWRANFGNPPGSGSGGGLGGTGAVPEPGTLVLVCLLVPLFVSRRLGRVRG